MDLIENRTKRRLQAVLFAVGVATSLLSQIAFAQPTLLVDTGAASAGHQSLFGINRTGCTTTDCVHFQYLSGQFTLTTGATLDSVQAWMWASGPMSMVVRLYTDNGGVPGTSIFSKTYPLNYSNYTILRWAMFPGFNPVLGPGTYWLAFEPASGSSYAEMDGPAPNPLPNYAFYADGNNGYVNFARFGQHPGLSIRILGTAAAAPTYPSGTFTRVIQVDPNVGVNVDRIDGAAGAPATISLGGSDHGLQFARGGYTSLVLGGSTLASSGPIAGAYSFSNFGVGSARGISFASFNNNLTVPQTFKLNTVLDGEFFNDRDGLPNGFLRAGAAIRVFDTDKFNAAINASGMGLDQFLLGGYTPTTALDPTAVFQDTATKLGGAQIGTASVDFGNSCFPSCTVPVFDQVLTTPMSTGLFTVGAGKNFTVMFDVATSGVMQQLGSAIGTGQVDFYNTLKPAANIFTDASGNPVTGIGAVGAQPVLPPAVTNVTLAPPSGTALVGVMHSVTAAVTAAGATPVPNTLVKFSIVSGPNSGLVNAGMTDANGQAVFSYAGQGGPGTDSIQARVGAVQSNVVQQTWVSDTTPPVIVPQVSGTLGSNGWYKSNVSVGWTVSDPESGIASSTGCGTTTLTTDTAGVTLKCSASNGAGLSTSVSVTVKIDRTGPVISGMPAVGCLVSTNNQESGDNQGDHGNFVTIATVSAADVLSGLAAGSLKVSGTSNPPPKDGKPQIVITPNGSGGFVVEVRADGSGNSARVYTVTATAADLAGNTTTVTGSCTAPKGQE